MDVMFPHLARVRSMRPRFIGAALEPQQSITGATSVIPSMAGRWQVEATFLLWSEAAMLQWDAFVACMEGGLGVTRVPVQRKFMPLTRDGRPASWDTVAGLSGAQTHEHFGLAAAPLHAFTVAAASLRATDLRITPTVEFLPIRPGQFFSLGDRLYRVQLHWQDGGGHVIRVQPPLREAVAAGSGAIVNRPVCRMHLTNAEEAEVEHNGSEVVYSVAAVFEETVTEYSTTSSPPPGPAGVWDDNAVWS